MPFNHDEYEVIDPDHGKLITAVKIIDIGANVGAFYRWARARWPRSFIECYEPHPENFKKLEQTVLSAPNKGNCCLGQLAVLDKRCESMPLVFEGLNCGEHSLFRHTNEGKPKQSVNVPVIDAATLPKADILKIDAEGAETAILRRLHQVKRLQEFTCVMYEFHDATGADYMDSLMRVNGFTQLSRINHSLHRGITKWFNNAKN